MCPDNDTPDTGNTAPAEQNPTLAEDDKFRRTVEPSAGPNANGYDDQIKQAHTITPDGVPVSAADIAGEGAADDAVSSNVKSDIEPSMPAPDAPHVPDVPLEG
jgi:hypothetical protein